MTFRIDGTTWTGSIFSGLIRVNGAAPTTAAADRSTGAAAAHDNVQLAAHALVGAFGHLSVTSAPTYSAPRYAPGPLPAVVSASFGVPAGSRAVLQTTQAVNTRTTTARTSSVLALDLGTAVSTLQSRTLGLDLTTQAGVSRLASSGGLGLDVTSPARVSLLASATALGLDLSSATAPSVLSSIRALGLDLASPETASRLYSASLGLDLTSPDAASTLSSALRLGLDVTSPETQSVLRSSGALGLDVSSPAAVSTLASSRDLGLDVTSPRRASLLASAAALGLDLTSPNAASVLRSAQALGLDLTSPETASRLYSATLPLDLTSPDAASRLSSALALGLDVTSPETQSVLRSSGALGLDITSPETASRLVSSTNLGLDVTSASRASVLKSSSGLGLDLTSPDAASVLTSSATLGLDVTSPQTGSSLASSALGLDLTSANRASTLTSSASLALDTTDRASTLTSSATLGLDVTSAQRASTIASTAEMNTSAATSFGTSLAFTLGSTSAGTLSGTYVGTNAAANATSLVFNVLSGGVVSGTATTMSFEVRDQTNALLFTYNGTVKGGTAISLGTDIGLSVKFANGTLLNGATASTPVSRTANTVDTAAAFNAAGAGKPTFDGGVTVKAGSFTVNGATITIVNSDSVNSVLAKINAVSGTTGVTAAVANDAVTLTTTGNSEDAIVLGTDNTNFLTATKLSGAVTVKGNVRDDQQVFSKTTQFASVTNGAFTINGTSIAVTAATDTLTTVMNRINASAGGVTATFDSVSGKLVLTGNSASENQIAVASDTSGFLTAAKLATTNTVVGNLRDDTQAFASTTQFASVTNGAFSINGVSISVNRTTDSLATVISRINASAAGVTAAYDATANTLTLTGKTNSEDLITVGTDTSGFLTAAKLATANTVRGHLSEDTVAFSNLSRFSSVTAGSFVVDGKTIAVATSDSIQSIVSRINASGARVTASFDSATNKVKLLTTYISEDQVPVGSDTSGFLSAAGITATNTVAGNVRDDQQTLSKTTQFGAVATGAFTINGVSIAVNRTTDTLSSVIARITASSAGVTASYDSAADRLVLTAKTNSEDLITVGSDTSGFLTAAKLATQNTNRGHLSEDGVPLYDLSQFSGVTNGSFVVDGRTIAVSTSDTVNALVARINASGARVTAAFDTTANRLVLTSTYANEDQIPVGSDTSGFLSSAKLSAANTVVGNIPDDTQVLAKTSQFGSVVNGAFSINGASIAVNAATDTLQSLIARISASAAGVTASFDTVTSHVVLVGKTNSEEQIVVGSDTSGFLAAASLATANTQRGNLRDDQQALAKTTQFGSVTSGSFTINGAAIAVNAATDTLASVIARINTSSAGVTAAYDAPGDRLVLTSVANTEDAIAVSADTTGFLSAAKLATGNTTRGNLRDDQQTLTKTAQFAAVTTGSFTINGHTIAVNASTDSLTSVIARINASNAGVTAAYDGATDRLVLTGTANSEDLITVASDTSGFLAAAHLATGNTVRGHLAEDGVVLSDVAAFAGVVNGSFTIDGHEIAVDTASDTIRSLVDRINQSGARVSASFDAATKTLRLAATYASEDALSIGSDTSGFLAAAGIDTANTQRGNIHDDRQTLAKTSQFGTVASGTFAINGVSIAVDRTTDTFASVVARINGANAGVTAAYDAQADRLVLTSTTNGEQLIDVSADATGFLDAAHLATANTVRGHLPEDGVALRDLARFGSVTAGSFVVDGHAITLDPTTDTIQSIVARINASGARVAASFDATANALRLQATYDSEDPIPVGADTTGFLAAARLDPANSILGNLPDDEQTLAKTTQFAAVTDGSFTVNGTRIAVNASTDTLRSIVARIDSAGAGVTATFDSAAGRILLAGTSASEDQIVVGDDTSGFLAAAALASANTVRGNIRDDQQALARTTQFAGVSSGAFVVNGATIGVDAATDTLSTVIARINASSAGVTAAYDTVADQLVLTANANGEEDVAVTSDTTGFLAAAKLASANTARGNIRDDLQTLAKTTQFASVSDGAFTINGTRIAVDAANDTLSSIISRINAANARVTAAYDATNDVVTLAATTDSEDPIVVADDTSGFLAAARLSTSNTTRGHLAEDTVPLADLARFASVVPGSFVLDGQTIAVSTTDTIQSLVSRINTSGARVTAAFDAQANRLSFVTDAATEDAVAIGGDTSGFLAAAGIDAASTLRGNVRDDHQVLGRTSQFASVGSGGFSINGTAIAVDAATDTLATVIDRINAANAGVVARYDAVSDRMRLVATADGEQQIAITNDTSGFAAAAGLATEDTVRGHVPEDGVALRDLARFGAVSAGSFTVDGHAIAIDPAADTVQSVVARINASGARVTAQYDTASDRIVLQGTVDGEDPLPLGADPTGFLAAAGLDAANTIVGNLADDEQVLAKTTQFAGVSSGSFTINGATVTVDASVDSLRSVLAKIDAAGAGVTARFDAASNRIVLTGTTDSEDLIALGTDDTGFLAAARLDSANTERGNLPDDQQVLAKTSQFASTTVGSFTVGGVRIDVDPAVDTFASLVDRINAAGAGVSAAYDRTLDRVVLTNDGASSSLVAIGGDTSGFLDAAGIDAANTVRGRNADTVAALRDTSRFASVRSGSFAVNGRTISLDAANDSLSSVLAHVNQAGAGVTAAYDAAADRVTFTPDVAGAPLTLDADSTGFLAALGLPSGSAALRANPDAAFNATGAGAPMFDDGLSVRAGSFTVNGVRVDVAVNDSITSVLARITAAQAGVAARYDSASQTVTLEATTPSAQPIALANDTSGFLAAVKLDGTAQASRIAVPADATVALRQVKGLQDVHAGTLTVDGRPIAIDPARTTMRQIVDQINGIGAMVGAELDDATGKLTLRAGRVGGTPLQLADTSGLLAALGIPTAGANRLVPRAVTGSKDTVNADETATEIANAAAALNQMIDYYGASDARTRSTLRAAIDFMGASGADGISVTAGAAPHVVVDQARLAATLAANGRAVASTFGSAADAAGAATIATRLLDGFADAVKASYLAKP